MGDHDLKRQELSIPMDQVYKIALIMFPAILVLYMLPYMLCWFPEFTGKLRQFIQGVFSGRGFFVLRPYLVRGTIAILAGIVLHELLHGLGWVFFAQGKFRSLRFGFMVREMAPYAHCTEPLPVTGYRIGILLPAVVLGLLPAMSGILTGSFSRLCYGMLFTWAASGDLIMLWHIRKLKGGSKVLDHPEKLGCIIMESEAGRSGKDPAFKQGTGE